MSLAKLSTVFHADRCNGEGLAALLDLQTRIEREMSPEYLLIDTQIGITEIGGLVTTLLADAVVCVVECDPEHAEGSRNVIRGIFAAPRFPGQLRIKVLPVLVERAADPSYDWKQVARVVHSEVLHEQPELSSAYPKPLLLTAPPAPSHDPSPTERRPGDRLDVLRALLQIPSDARPGATSEARA
jgi:hypothetical protein